MVTREGLTEFLNEIGGEKHEICEAVRFLPSKKDAIKMDVHAFLTRLQRVNRVNGSWQAQCPAHDDRKPSLSIGLGEDERILLCCHAGCSTETILKTMGLAFKDVGPNDHGYYQRQNHLVATYDYTDEEGKLLYQIVRFTNKDFRQRRPDGKNGWIWNLKNTRRVLYRLPEVSKAPQVIVVEGEKDVDNLEKAGFVATTNPMGASKWREEYKEFLRDKDVIVIPDNDQAGRKHGEEVTRSILQVAKSVKLIDLTKWVDDKGDVSDFLKSKKTNDLIKIIESTPALTVEQMTKVVKTETRDAPNVDLKGWLAGQVEHDGKDIVDHVLTLESFEYEGVRVEVAKKLQYRVAKLDEWYDNRNRTSPAEETSVPSPWPEAVTLGEIASEIFATLRRHIIMPEECAIAVTLWTCASWAYDRFDVFPYLLLSSPMKRCGKTRLLNMLRDLVDKGLQAASVSPAALFRVVEAERPTLLLDEFDQQTNADDMLNLLNSGHERNGAAIRLVPKGKEYVHKRFSTYCPKVIAMIGKPKDTLVDRSIVVTMQRKRPQDRVERFGQEMKKSLEVVKRKLMRWREDLLDPLPEVEPLHTNNDREADNWMPLLAIAEMAGNTWPQRALDAAKALSKDIEDDSVKIRLLQDIKGIFERQQTDRIPTSDLLEELKSLEESPWNDWGHGKGLNARHLASLLKPFSIQPKVLRIEDKTPRGYEFADFQDAFEAYIPLDKVKSSATSATSLNLLNLETQQSTSRSEDVADISSNKNNPVADVADNAVHARSGRYLPEQPPGELGA